MIQRRLASLRRSLAERELHAFLVSSPRSIRYLTGFSGSNALCLITQKEKHFVTDARYSSQSREEISGWKRHIVGRGLAMEIHRLCLVRHLRRIGFEAAHLTVATHHSYRRLFRGTSFVPTEGLVEALRVSKDNSELVKLRRAASITDRVYRDVLSFLRPGIREIEVSGLISSRQREYGAEGDAFEPIVASGTRSVLPHARATRRRIKSGDTVVLDFGCVFEGYHSDLTRTVFVGRTTQKMKALYAKVAEAQHLALSKVKSGVKVKELDSVARDYLSDHGVGKFLIHSLGHGLGLEVHEAPRVSHFSHETLIAGSVITIEPGVYIPGVGGIRIEDDVLVGKRGCELLTSSSKELTIV